MSDNKLYPPVDPADLIDAHGFENITRVVVSQTGVYGRTTDGQWIQFVPLKMLEATGGKMPRFAWPGIES